jgi:hypothetical protein
MTRPQTIKRRCHICGRRFISQTGSFEPYCPRCNQEKKWKEDRADAIEARDKGWRKEPVGNRGEYATEITNGGTTAAE